MVEFNVRIDFFRDLEESGPKGYVGSALREGLRALVVPRVGEYVHGLGDASVWYGPTGRTGGPYSAVAAVEHAPVPAFKADPAKAQEQQPTVTVVVRALWPGDGPLAGERVLRDYDRQGWQLHFFSNNAPIQAFPGQPLM
jgi:hypothetical protein